MSYGLLLGALGARRHDDDVKELFGTGDDSSIYYDGNDLIIDPRDSAATGTLVLTASVDGEPHLRLASGADHTTSLVAGDVWFDGSNFKGYNGSATVTLDVAAASGGGWTDDGTRVRLTTATDHVAIGTVSPTLTGSGDLTIAGNFDFEGYGAMGNGLAASAAITLTIDRDHSGSNLRQLSIGGIQTHTTGSAVLMHTLMQPGGTVINSGGAHSIVSTLYIVEPIITETSGSATIATTTYIASAPTEGTNNYSFFIDSGDFRCDGSILPENAAGYQLLNEAATATNPTVCPNRGSLTSGMGANASGDVSLIRSGAEKIRLNANVNIKADMFIDDGSDFILENTTGSKIGTATAQKIAFWNSTPVIQQTTGASEATFVENSGGAVVNVDSTAGGYTFQQVVQVLQTIGLLA